MKTYHQYLIHQKLEFRKFVFYSSPPVLALQRSFNLLRIHSFLMYNTHHIIIEDIQLTTTTRLISSSQNVPSLMWSTQTVTIPFEWLPAFNTLSVLLCTLQGRGNDLPALHRITIFSRLIVECHHGIESELRTRHGWKSLLRLFFRCWTISPPIFLLLPSMLGKGLSMPVCLWHVVLI